jgi:predicted phage terminase large subunit-like protein
VRSIEIPGAPISDKEDEDVFTNESVEPAQHHKLMLDLFERMESGEIQRGMLFLPPGSAKSTYGSIVFPSWFMGRQGNRNVILVSHTTELARKLGRRGRQVTRSPHFNEIFGCQLSPDTAAADEWSLTNGSEFMAAGIITGVSGNRADLLVIDDPLRGQADADSETIRAKIRDAYFNDLLTRLKPGGRELIIQTRWHEDDLSGGLLPEDYKGESGMIACRDGRERFVINIPAECERHDDPLQRNIGDLLWPEWFRPEELLAVKHNPAQSRTWSALYQQRPAPDSGTYFTADMIRSYTTPPDKSVMRIYGASDYAVTADGGDYTCHVVVGVDPENRIYLLDVWRAQSSSDVWVETFCDLVKQYKPIEWGEEKGQINAALGPFIRRRMLERQAYTFRRGFASRTDKAIRAQSIRGRMAMLGLYVPLNAPWRNDFVTELMSFPAGRHDDQVDALGLIGQLLDHIEALKPKVEKQYQNRDELIFTGVDGGTRIVSNLSVMDIVKNKEKKAKRSW